MDQDNAVQLGKYLSARRRELNYKSGKNYTQTDISVKVGIPQGTYNKYETGKVLPSDRNKHKLAKFFGPEIYEICGGPVLMPDNPILRKIARAWTKLPEEDQKQYGDAILKAVAEWEAREPSYQAALVVE
jgi:DNA-binding XRE family transcriptional regulator